MKYVGPSQSGSVAAQTASRNTFGQYYRARVDPDETATAARTATWAQMALGATSWSNDLVDVERAAWNGFSIVRSNSLGVQQPLQGRSAFLSVYLAQATYGGTFFREPPPLPEWQVMSFGVSSVTGQMLMDWSPVLSSGTSLDNRLVFYATAAVGSGVTRPPGRSYWQLITSAGGAITPPYDVSAFYFAAKGSLPAPGEITWWRAREVSNGRFGAEWRARMVMA